MITLAKEGNVCASDGKMCAVAALLIAVAILGGSYMLSQSDMAPKVNINTTNGPTSPTIYLSSTPIDRAISVSATSSQNVAPDLLLVQVRVVTEAKSAKQSVSDNAAVMANLTPKLKALGIADEDVQTTSYSVDPVYSSEYICDKSGGYCHYDSNLTGYLTTHTLTLNVKNLSIGGDLIDASSSVGENQTFIDYVSFTLQDTTKRSIGNSLLQNASAQAKSKADKMASGLGVTAGDVLSISESSSYNYPTPNYYKSMSSESGASVPSTSLSGGQIEVSATVTASFEVQ